MDATTAGLISTAIAGFSGLAGASIGALVTVSVSRSTSARQWNHDLFTESRGLYVDLVETINEQYVSLGAATSEMEVTFRQAMREAREVAKPGDTFHFVHEKSPETTARIIAITAKFRQVMAKAVLYGDEKMNDQLGDLDTVREKITKALNEGNPTSARAGVESMSVLLKPLYRTVQRGIARHSLVALNNFHPFWGKKKSRNELLDNIALLDKRDAEDAAKSEKSAGTDV